VRESGIENLDLIAGSMKLAGADLALARKRDTGGALKKALAPVRRRYDVVVIDCPPGLSVLTLNGLGASSAFILPVVPQDLAVEAVGRFLEGWEQLQRSLRTKPELLGILLNMVDHRTNLTEEMVKEIRKAYGRRVFKTEVPINVRLAEAPGYGMTIFEYQSWSSGAQAYRYLGAEAIRRARRAGLL
jgi:chromosome partitioning protein